MPDSRLTHFNAIDIEHFPQRLDELLRQNLKAIDQLLEQQDNYTWDNLMRPLEDMDDRLERLFSPMSHLHAVVNSPELRECYQACLPRLSAYEAAIGHNQALYTAICSLDRRLLDSAQQKILEDSIRDFELSGVALSAEKKQRFEAIQTRLSALSNLYENNVLDATQAFTLHITDEARLKGLPEHAIHNAKRLAEEQNHPGWVLTLEIPCYLAVMTYGEDRSLREELYHAYVTRASDEGFNAGQFDNSAVMDEILALRHEKANLLDFANYAELSLATKMAKSGDEVMGFLSDLCHKARQQAKADFKNLQSFAVKEFGLDDLKPWDIAYLSEKKKQALHAISQEELRPFFPLPKVMDGLFTILKKLYGLHMQEVSGVDVWHPDVRCYEIQDEHQNTRGFLYMDLFARPHKRGGAWMDSCQSRRKLADGTVQLPVAMLTCNFAKAHGDKPATLSHDELLTLFHELGHCLHHVLTQVDYLSASGIHGVEWDAVELPSQFFENWCWEEESLQGLSAHVETGKSLPNEKFKQLLAAKNFHSAMAMLRQLEFSMFDFRIHQEYEAQKPAFIASILADVRNQVSVVPVVPYSRFQHSFTHIFGGGYAAGYYSYKWAEVLSSDAFARFEEEGVFNEETGRDFLHHILEVGGSKKAEEAFVDFRGRKATIDALLKHNGIQS